MDIKLHKIAEISHFPYKAVLDLVHDENVEVFKAVLAYDGFSLVVELGKDMCHYVPIKKNLGFFL